MSLLCRAHHAVHLWCSPRRWPRRATNQVQIHWICSHFLSSFQGRWPLLIRWNRSLSHTNTHINTYTHSLSLSQRHSTSPVCRSMSQSVAGRCRTLQGVAVCCSVLQRVAVCCSTLQRVAEYCSARSRHSSCGSHLFGNHVLLFPRLFSYYPSRAYSTITLPETIQVLLASLQCPGGFN